MVFALNVVASVIVTLCWPVYLALFRNRVRQHQETAARDRSSTFGIGLQAIGVVLSWWPRTLFSPFISTFPLSVAAPVAAVLIAVGSVWLSHLALKTLGEQWTFVAKVGNDHRLVRHGLYGVVRHPLYLFFFGLTVATGMVWTTPMRLAIGMIVFVCGVWIRVHAEEQLLRERFGSAFDDYVRQVPAFFPRLGLRA